MRPRPPTSLIPPEPVRAALSAVCVVCAGRRVPVAVPGPARGSRAAEVRCLPPALGAAVAPALLGAELAAVSAVNRSRCVCAYRGQSASVRARCRE